MIEKSVLHAGSSKNSSRIRPTIPSGNFPCSAAVRIIFSPEETGAVS